MPLNSDRDTPRRDGVQFGLPAAPGTRIFAGSIVGVDASGYAIPASPNAVAIVGISQEHIDNRDGLEDLNVPVRRGVFALPSVVGINRSHYGAAVTATDDTTVALLTADPTPEAPAPVLAGIIRDVDEYGVWVEF